jgi:hypothetical protein
MPPGVLDFFYTFVPLTTSCVVGLVGMKIFLNYRRDILIGRSSGEETKNLVEDVSVLREEVLFLREGLEDVTERLEFHERLLTKAVEEPFSTPV